MLILNGSWFTGSVISPLFSFENEKIIANTESNLIISKKENFCLLHRVNNSNAHETFPVHLGRLLIVLYMFIKELVWLLALSLHLRTNLSCFWRKWIKNFFPIWVLKKNSNETFCNLQRKRRKFNDKIYSLHGCVIRIKCDDWTFSFQ